MKQTNVLVAVLLLALFAASASALYYRNRAATLRSDWTQAQSTLQGLQLQLASRRDMTNPANPTPPPPASDERTEAPPADEEETLEALRVRIRELESERAKREGLLASLQAQAATPAPAEPERRRDRRSWFEDLQQTDPERYEQIIQRRQESRERMHAALSEKSDFLYNRDTSTMAPEEKETFELTVQLLDETWGLVDQMNSQDLERGERREIRRTMMGKLDELRPLLEAERDRELYALGLDFGYNEKDAVLFVDYLNEINELTSLRPLYENMWSGRGGRPRSDPGEPPSPRP